MARISLPDGAEVTITSGGESFTYAVMDGQIVVLDSNHAAAILAAVPGSSLAPEPPASKSKPESGKEK